MDPHAPLRETFDIKTQNDEEIVEIFKIAFSTMTLQEIEARLGNKFQVGTSEMPKVCNCGSACACRGNCS